MGEAKNAAEGHKLIKPRPFSGLRSQRFGLSPLSPTCEKAGSVQGLGLRRGILKSTNVGTGFGLLGVRV